MHFLILALFVVALVFAPQAWARYTFSRYSTPDDRLPGTGGELARHLLDRYGMQDVMVEVGDEGGDHYDPTSKTVRLSPSNHDVKSLTAVAVAAHEVGHAIQHHRQEPSFERRTRMVVVAHSAQRLGSGLMLILPIVMLVTRTPMSGLVMFGLGLISLGSAALVHLMTLPVELDASYGKALPILRDGYISSEDEVAVEKILKAAALTYVAGSLASLLSIGRWITLLRR